MLGGLWPWDKEISKANLKTSHRCKSTLSVSGLHQALRSEFHLYLEPRHETEATDTAHNEIRPGMMDQPFSVHPSIMHNITDDKKDTGQCSILAFVDGGSAVCHRSDPAAQILIKLAGLTHFTTAFQHFLLLTGP